MKSVSITFGLLASFLLAPAFALAADSLIACPMIYQPVCAAHQVQCIKAPCYLVYQTYGNSCMAGAADSKVIHEGECTGAETGPIKGPKADEPTPPVLGQPYTPPASCIAWYDGCNSCGRGANGEAFCTMRACLVQGVGYCTTYASTTSNVVPRGGMWMMNNVPTNSDATSSYVYTQPIPLQSGWLHSFWESCWSLVSWMPFWPGMHRPMMQWVR